MYLDNILLSGISSLSWQQSQSSKKASGAAGVSTSGCRARARRENQECAPPVNLPTGISRESINLKHGSLDLSKGSAERKGVEPIGAYTPTRIGALQAPSCHQRDSSPLIAASEGSASQTFASHSQCNSICLHFPCLALPFGIFSFCVFVRVFSQPFAIIRVLSHKLAHRLGCCVLRMVRKSTCVQPVVFFQKGAFNGCNPLISFYAPLVVLDRSGFSLLFQSPHGIVDWNELLFVSREIKSALHQLIADFWNGNDLRFSQSQNCPNCFCKGESRGRRFGFRGFLTAGNEALSNDSEFYIRRERITDIFRHCAQTVYYSSPIKYFRVDLFSCRPKLINSCFGFFESGFDGISHGGNYG